MKELRQYQIDKSIEGFEILKKHKLVYISAMVRTGKTAISLNICKLYGFKNVLFLTKKIAIDSILSDYKEFSFESCFELKVMNNESMHKVFGEFDVIVMDEAHRFGAYPKPSSGCKEFKKRFSNLPIIFLSGTPNPESYSQIFHQFWVSKYSPFEETNFYKWAKNYVNVTQKRIGQHMINDYSDANKKLVNEKINHLMVKLTQEEAGFSSSVNEHIINIDSPALNLLIKLIKKTRLIDNDILEEKGFKIRICGEIVADTPAKLMQKIHQISAGTCLNEAGELAFIDHSRAKYIQSNFEGKKIVIFYQFKGELQAIKNTFGSNITEDVNEFNTSNKNIALQLVSGREGINLSKADCIVYYNLSFSAVTYFQSKDRMTTIDRLVNDVYFICLNGGLESHILEQLNKKKSFTLDVFKKQVL